MPGSLMDESEIKQVLESRELTYCGVLGQGSFGQVVRVIHKDTKQYAVKISLLADETMKYSEREVGVLMKVKSENVVQYFKHWLDNIGGNLFLFIQLELCFKNLMEFVYNNRINGGVEIIKNPKFFHHCFLQILRGLQALHMKNIVHRDLHAHNILVALPEPTSVPEIQIKITDFGLSRYINSSTKNIDLSRGIANEYFRAPELEPGNCVPYDYKVDMYSAGVVLYFLTRYLPNRNDWSTELDELRNGRRNPKHLAHNNELLHLTILTLLRINPKERPTAEDILEKWVQGTNTVDGPKLQASHSLSRHVSPYHDLIDCAVKIEGEDFWRRCELTETSDYSSLRQTILQIIHFSADTNVELYEQTTVDQKERTYIISNDDDVEKMFASAKKHDGQRINLVVKRSDVSIGFSDSTQANPNLS
ncbi:serine/threonine-protein kinase/endoribonuclease IRE1-like [Xenia sp. Carnegie-2017]|uniref:serine/threonine-protein kinase/endoribonuclease IRE1-like n=1 Tax=Xenia sp. Carnegie-2017 TaxID=2897299 RepID=UPI001F046E14|nr:serine/threonine-protein kinase/endoribonuclease IRE1-like [Xenia sp. Carnegie-2017]